MPSAPYDLIRQAILGGQNIESAYTGTTAASARAPEGLPRAGRAKRWALGRPPTRRRYGRVAAPRITQPRRAIRRVRNCGRQIHMD